MGLRVTIRPNARRPPDRPSSPLAWGLFLGVSWTWCIGMFLPVLLVRDLGPGGFVVFALPNVLGAAAMGWVLERQDVSAEWVRRHWEACWLFSAVTILFHIFFAGWILSLLLGIPGGIAAIALGLAVFLSSRTRPSRDLPLTLLIYLASLACAALFLYHGDAAIPGAANRLPGADIKVLCLLPVCCFGFGLCPYLDLTFHRARQAVDPRGSRIAFTTGFGLFFFSMICFTLAYTGPLADRLDHRVIGLAATLVGVHMVLQSGTTVGLHLREILRTGATPTRATIFSLAAAGIVAAVSFLTRPNPHTGELPYLVFMSFYGLLFPAYVLAALLGKGQVHARLWLLSCLAATPFYYAGFILHQTPWLLPGLALAILGALWSARQVKTHQ